MIIFAAIRLNNTIIYGKDHAECIRRAVKDFGFDTPIPIRSGGFLTNKYRFVFREEAKYIAVKAGQVPAGRMDSNRVFISEEIWADDAKIKHTYDENDGYRIAVEPEKTEAKNE